METWFYVWINSFVNSFFECCCGASLEKCTYISSATVPIILRGEVRIIKKKKGEFNYQFVVKAELMSPKNQLVRAGNFLNPSYYIYLYRTKYGTFWRVCQNFKVDLLWESSWWITFSMTAVNIVPFTEWKGIWLLKNKLLTCYNCPTSLPLLVIPELSIAPGLQPTCFLWCVSSGSSNDTTKQ